MYQLVTFLDCVGIFTIDKDFNVSKELVVKYYPTTACLSDQHLSFLVPSLLYSFGCIQHLASITACSLPHQSI